MADRTSTVRVNVITDASGAGAAIGKFGRLAGLAALGTAALGVGAAVGATKLYAFGDAADDANVSIEQGIKTMKLFGKQNDDVAKRVEDHAKAVSLATAVDINSIKATQAKLLTFRDLAKTADDLGGSFDRATAAAVDMAAKGFGTAETNAVQLGKALADPANGLAALKKTGALTADQITKIGEEFKKTGDLAKAQGQILSAVEAQVAGTAEKQAGGFEKMTNALKIFGQELATKALPYLDRFGNFMIETGAPAMLRFGRNVSEVAVPALQRVGAFIQNKVLPALVSLSGWIQDHVVPMFAKVLPDALEGARKFFQNVSKSVGDNESNLREMGKAAKKVAEFIVDKVIPACSEFAKTTLPALGTAIGAAITFLSDVWSAWNRVWDIVKKVACAIGSVATAIHNLPSLPSGLGAVLPRGSSGSSGTKGQPFTHEPTGRAGVTINFNGPVTDPRGTAREVEKVLLRNGYANGRAVVG